MSIVRRHAAHPHARLHLETLQTHLILFLSVEWEGVEGGRVGGRGVTGGVPLRPSRQHCKWPLVGYGTTFGCVEYYAKQINTGTFFVWRAGVVERNRQ